MTGDKRLLYNRDSCKNKSTQRCVDEGLNLTNTIWRHKMSLKTTWLFKDGYFEQGVKIDNK